MAMTLFATTPVLAQPTLIIEDYVATPITGRVDGKGSNELLLSRVNTLREETGGARRFFISDLNGPLYVFDKATKEFSVYLDFNGNEGKTGIFRKLTHAQREVLHRAHRGSGVAGIQPAKQRRFAGPERRGLHDDRGREDTGIAAERRRADRVDRYASIERHVRRHGPRAAARAAQYPQSPDGRSDLQPDGSPR
ncbi:MAG: hypothetical protein Q7R30_04985 [Acidobacteriota bacterium]|nr:hypothetical protein [Acidobacteriota bacterium]